MTRLFVYLFTVLLLVVVACSSPAPEGLDEKKAQLKEYQNQVKELQRKITTLEGEIAAQDSNFSTVSKDAALVTVLPIEKEKFEHFIEVRGNVASDRNVTIGAEAPAEVTQVNVEKGDQVRKGQLLVVQDAETVKRSIEELQTSLELARTRYERQANLWDKKIGTEMQYLEAKNNVESLERRLASAQTQLNSYLIRAPFSGTVDEVYVKEGEMAQPGVPMLRLVSLQEMYIVADISETYLGDFKRGDSVTVNFPSLNNTIKSTISSVGQVINQNNRTFEVQVKLPADESLLLPNLLAVLHIKDFEASEAVAIPTNLIQIDNRGDYVFVANQTEEGLVANKKRVERGLTYNNETMIKSGLEPGDHLIDEGSREVAEGIKVKLADQNVVDNAVSSK